MNRFLSKKRLPKGRTSPEHQEKATLDLSSVLPSNDDFRTSLIMPNLSARFSMLREQDDPATKIGKASDDSVLYPRRISRFPDFGFAGANGLNDISEVNSLKSATTHHTQSVARRDSSDGSAHDSESTNTSNVMDRARPIEGNNLFGGRQKVYRIPTSASTKSLGRLVYAEDDLSVSSYQRYRDEERAAEERVNNAAPFDASTVGLATTSTTAITPEPKRTRPRNYSFEQRRPSIESSSVSDAVYDPTWTPATSVTSSQPRSSPAAFVKPKNMNSERPLDRSLTKRRMYEQTLDQNRQEQQISALTRLNSLHQQRVQNGGRPRPTNLPLHTSNNPTQTLARPLSPTEQLTTFDNIARSASPVDSRPQSPSFFPMADDMNMLATTMQPSDRGKATAMGAFHMPTQQFDEEQYLQRLQQLQGAVTPRDETVQEPEVFKLARFDSANQSPIEGQGPRGLRSRPTSPPEQNSPNPFSVFQNAAAQNRSNHNSPEIRQDSTFPDTHRTFFGDINASDDDDEDSIIGEYDRRDHAPHSAARFKPTDLEGIEEHPDTRYDVQDEPEQKEENDAERESFVPHPSPLRFQTHKAAQEDFDQLRPEEVPAAAGGVPRALGGLIHQHLRTHSNVSSNAPSLAPRNPDNRHLRNLSNQSSVYTNGPGGRDDSLPDLNTSARSTWGHLDPNDAVDVDYNHRSNPWDLDDLDRHNHYRTIDKRAFEADPAPRQGPRVLASAGQSITGTEHNSQRSSQVSNWQPDHRRELSDGTVQEREAFANELAARQKAIQENLRSIVEVESQPPTPQQNRENPFKRSGSKETPNAADPLPESMPQKAKKMLGISPTASSPVTSAPPGTVVENRAPPHPAMNQPGGQRSPPMGPGPRGFPDMRRPMGPHPSMGPQNPPNGPPRHMGGRQMPPPMSGRPFHGPNAYGNPMNRDDRQQARTDSPREQGMPMNAKRSPVPDHQFHMQHGPARPMQSTSQQSPVLPQNGMTSPHANRMPSNNRAGMPSPAEYQSFGPRSGQPSPGSAPTSATFKHHDKHSPRGPPPTQHASVPTPPPSGSTTPVAPAQAPLVMPPIPNIKAGGVLRKRAVQKHEISEPTLISSTSNVDTVDLPPGASLKNGMEPAPPLSEPRRKRGPILFSSKKDDHPHAPRTMVASPQVRAMHSQYTSPGAPPPVPGSAGSSPRLVQESGPGRRSNESHASSARSPVQNLPEGFERVGHFQQQSQPRRVVAEGGMF